MMLVGCHAPSIAAPRLYDPAPIGIIFPSMLRYAWAV